MARTNVWRAETVCEIDPPLQKRKKADVKSIPQSSDRFIQFTVSEPAAYADDPVPRITSSSSAGLSDTYDSSSRNDAVNDGAAVPSAYDSSSSQRSVFFVLKMPRCGGCETVILPLLA